MITAELALRLRERGLLLPLDRDYNTLELRNIAARLRELRQEFDRLDARIVELAAQEEARDRS